MNDKAAPQPKRKKPRAPREEPKSYTAKIPQGSSTFITVGPSLSGFHMGSGCYWHRALKSKNYE